MCLVGVYLCKLMDKLQQLQDITILYDPELQMAVKDYKNWAAEDQAPRQTDKNPSFVERNIWRGFSKEFFL